MQSHSFSLVQFFFDVNFPTANLLSTVQLFVQFSNTLSRFLSKNCFYFFDEIFWKFEIKLFCLLNIIFRLDLQVNKLLVLINLINDKVRVEVFCDSWDLPSLRDKLGNSYFGLLLTAKLMFHF